jgi:hypothetical protein
MGFNNPLRRCHLTETLSPRPKPDLGINSLSQQHLLDLPQFESVLLLEQLSRPVDKISGCLRSTSVSSSSGHSTITHLSNLTPEGTRATRCGALTDRHRSWPRSA